MTFALLALVLAGCDSGTDAPASLEAVEKRLGYPPRGQARIVINGERASVHTAVFSTQYDCSTDISFWRVDHYNGGGLLFGGNECRVGVVEQLAKGGSLGYNVYGGTPSQRHVLLNDSTIQGVMSGVLGPVGLFGDKLRIELTYTAAGPPLRR